MALRINKAGLLDTIQDAGRYGFQQLGINPGGAMDLVAMKMANVLTGNAMDEAVLEMHFPAPEIIFETAVLIALAGADFSAEINGDPVPLLHPVIVPENAVLRFRKKSSGARLYLAIKGGFLAEEWLGSCSTHLKVKAGGFAGRSLQKNDRLLIKDPDRLIMANADSSVKVLNWSIHADEFYSFQKILFVPGAEYHCLDNVSKKKFETGGFQILPQSDRMGYRLKGDAMITSSHKEMISTAVTRGTIQLLPDGQLIILMADHQTTGGYPRIGHVISASMPALAQKNAGEKILFQQTALQNAEEYLSAQERNLQQLQNACNFRLLKYFNQ